MFLGNMLGNAGLNIRAYCNVMDKTPVTAALVCCKHPSDELFKCLDMSCSECIHVLTVL